MPRTADHDQRREQIVRALWKVIARQGIDQVSLRNVAAEAGVSVGRIQHYFGTKESLVRAGCQAMIAGAHARYTDQTADAPPLTRLRFVLTHAIPQTDTARYGTTLWYAYLAKSVDDPTIGTLLADTKRGTEHECARLITAAGTGLDPVPTARRLLALADGLALRVLINDLTSEDALEVLDAEVNGLLAARPANRSWAPSRSE